MAQSGFRSHSMGSLYTGSEAASSEDINPNLPDFKFESKTKFDGFLDYLQTKSREFQPKPPIPEKSIWDRKPPDFRHQSYVPQPPRRTTIFSQQPWRFGTYPGFTEKKTAETVDDVVLHPILRPRPKRSPEFKRRFRSERTYTSKIRMVKEGKLPQDLPYSDPKPPELRKLEPIEDYGLPEFDTKEERDPFDIKLHHKFIKQIHGIQGEPPSRDLVGEPLKLIKSPDPLFEADLVLKKDLWPKGMAYRHSAEYTRHKKIIRTAQSAFLERADRSLSQQWRRTKHGLPPIQDYNMPKPPANFIRV